jgi:hypothetical protein
LLQDAASLLATAPGVTNVNRPPFKRDTQDKIRAKLKKVLQARLKSGLHDLPTLHGVQSLSLATRYIEGGRSRFIEFVQAAMLNGCEYATKWLLVFQDLTPTERLSVSYDDVCAACGVKPSELLGSVTRSAVEMGIDAANLVAAATHPQVVAAGVAAAKDKSGVQDRQMLYMHSGFIPLPKNTGPAVNVNVQNTANAGAHASAQAGSSVGLPSLAEDLRIIGQSVAPQRRELPAATEPDPITFDEDADFDFADEPEPIPVLAGDHDG